MKKVKKAKKKKVLSLDLKTNQQKHIGHPRPLQFTDMQFCQKYFVLVILKTAYGKFSAVKTILRNG